MSEQRLIDANALIQDLVSKRGFYPAIVKCAVEQAPTVPAEVVVHCRECKYYQDNNGGYPNSDCRWRQDETPDADDFCSCGECRESEAGK